MGFELEAAVELPAFVEASDDAPGWREEVGCREGNVPWLMSVTASEPIGSGVSVLEAPAIGRRPSSIGVRPESVEAVVPPPAQPLRSRLRASRQAAVQCPQDIFCPDSAVAI